MRALLIMVAMTAGLAACGGSSSNTSDNAGPVDPGAPEVNYAALKPIEPSEAGLTRLEGEAFERFVKNGLRLQTSGYGYTHYPSNNDDLDFSAGAPEADGGGNYSQTNVHIAGVDEADSAKYDGRHWFVAYEPSSYNGELPGLQIVDTDPAVPDASVVGTFSFDAQQWGSATAIYLQKDGEVASHVVALRSQWGSIEGVMPGAVPSFVSNDSLEIWPGPVNSQVRVEFIDVNTPSSPSLTNTISLDGSLIDSRRIGNTLYLITRYDPWFYPLEIEHSSSDSRTANEAALADAKLADLLPKYRQGSAEAPLSVACYTQEDTQDIHGFHSMVNITAIDLSGQSIVSSECLSTGVDSLTMSQNALYLTGTLWQESEKTVIHKFSLEESGVAYAATGSVPGSIQWDAPYRVNEHGEDLRVVSTDHTDGISHHLYILRQSGNVLAPVAQLPNAERPAPIGKPDEDIFAVRFDGDRAYVVTFRRVDPLYVLDLSDSLDPKITGALEVPGFATYIHPINENYLFTLGQDADGETGWTQGIKTQLVKVSGGNPQLVGEMLIGDRYSHSEALYDLRALNLLEADEGAVRVSFPVSVYGMAGGEYSEWQYSGLQMLELNGLDSEQGTMQDKGVLIAEAATHSHHDYNGGVRRGLLHGTAVYYAHDNQIWFSQWGAADAPQGPIGGDPIACTEQIVYGLEVYVSGQFMQPIDNCDAQVVAVDGDYSETLTADYRDSLGSCVFYGAAERAGSYTITASLDGYETQVSEGVVVSQDVCHVQPRSLMLQLWPSAEL